MSEWTQKDQSENLTCLKGFNTYLEWAILR